MTRKTSFGAIIEEPLEPTKGGTVAGFVMILLTFIGIGLLIWCEQ